MRKHSPHQAVISIRPSLVLDPNPGHHLAVSNKFPSRNRGFAILELQGAIGNVLTMAKLRALLPPTAAPASLSDSDVVTAVANMVHTGEATLKFTSTDAGDLPWPDILRDLGRPDFEGTVPHLYADTVGKVTVGVGTMLASVAEAQALGFVVRKTGKPATAAEIADDYASVQKQYRTTPNKNATSYQTALDLPQSEIDRVLKVRAERSAHQLAARYAGWDKYPAKVKRALIDLRYNMNDNLNKFVTFQTAIEKAAQTNAAADWQAAAAASRRPQVSGTRNQWTSDMILQGGGVTQQPVQRLP